MSTELCLPYCYCFLFNGKEGFILEYVDDFDREVIALGSSAKLASFLGDRSKETEDIPIEEIRKKRGM